MNAHKSFAFTSALLAISSLHTAVWPFQAAQCRAVRCLLEQKIRSKVKKQNTTQNQKQIQNIKTHLSFASTSALPAISSSHTAVRPSQAARCRAVHWSLEQKIRRKYRKTKHNKNSATNFEHECAPVCRIHVSFACNQQLACCRETITGSEMQSGALATRTKK